LVELARLSKSRRSQHQVKAGENLGRSISFRPTSVSKLDSIYHEFNSPPDLLQCEAHGMAFLIGEQIQLEDLNDK
jgi:hypothetical protein